MSRRPWSVWSLVVALPTFLVWSWLTLRTSALDRLDQTITPRVDPEQTEGQIAAAIATLTHPAVIAVVLLVLAGWAQQRRLRKLATALVLSVVVGWGVPTVLKLVVRRARPQGPFASHFTTDGWAYPSSHATMIVVLAVMVGAAAATTRQPRRTQLFWRTLGAVVVALVALDRLAMGAQWFTDVVAGWLLGGTLAAFVLWVAGVHPVPSWELMLPQPRVTRQHGTCAVIYNPVKVLDEGLFRHHVRQNLTLRGWGEPLWLSTTPTDPGREMTQDAIRRHVDRVLVVGGDGTVRVVSSELANTGIPLAIVPAGTANLLARNLGIPLDEGAALDVAFDGDTYAIDLLRVTVDEDPASCQHFTVMAGMGIDAQVMNDTRDELKRAVKSMAYFVAVAQNLGRTLVDARVLIDRRLVSQRPASLMLVGNVGEIQAGLQLFPHARADDGLLDVIVSGPRGVTGWVRWGVERIYRQLSQNVDTHQGQHVRFEVDEPLPYELDGDTMGEARVFEVEVVPGALTIMMPRRHTRATARPGRN